MKKRVPRVRFKGFEAEWEERLVGNVCGTTSGGGTPRTTESHLWDGTIPWIQSSDVLEDVYCVKPRKCINKKALIESSARLIPENSIAVVTRVGVGKLALINFPYTTSQDFLSLSKLNIDEHFAVRAIATKLQDKKHKTQGTSIKGITKEELLNYAISVPNEQQEQQEIGNFFRQLDTNLSQHQTQLEKLQNLKQAMLQKMFPQGSATVPEIRFEGFTGEWDERKLGDIATPISNNSLSRSNLNYESGIAKNIHYGDILLRFDAILDANRPDVPFITEKSIVDNLSCVCLQAGDLIFADAAEDQMVGKSVELIKTNGEPIFAGLHTIVFRPTIKFASGYLGYYTNSESYRRQLYPLMQGTKVLSLSRGAFSYTTVCYPKFLSEQQKIGTYFRKLDELIALQRTQLDKLKQIKQACLAAMFV